MYLHDLAESFFIDIERGFKYNAQRQRKTNFKFAVHYSSATFINRMTGDEVNM